MLSGLLLTCGLGGLTGCMLQEDTVPLPSDGIFVGHHPESIVRGFGGAYYITLMGNYGVEDGAVLRIEGDALKTVSVGLLEPKGITFDGNYLYVADILKVWRIDENGALSVLVDSAHFPHPIRNLNDIAYHPERHSLIVSDMGAHEEVWAPKGLWALDSEEAARITPVGRVFEISLQDRQIVTLIEPLADMPTPNGVAVGSGGEVLVVDFFTGHLFSYDNGALSVVAEGFRGGDGLARDLDGNYYISSWTEGRLWQLSVNGERVMLANDIPQAADFYLDEERQIILLPGMKAGTLHRIVLSP